jgi:hypothetical protein
MLSLRPSGVVNISAVEVHPLRSGNQPSPQSRSAVHHASVGKYCPDHRRSVNSPHRGRAGCGPLGQGLLELALRHPRPALANDQVARFDLVRETLAPLGGNLGARTAFYSPPKGSEGRIGSVWGSARPAVRCASTAGASSERITAISFANPCSIKRSMLIPLR